MGGSNNRLKTTRSKTKEQITNNTNQRTKNRYIHISYMYNNVLNHKCHI